MFWQVQEEHANLCADVTHEESGGARDLQSKKRITGNHDNNLLDELLWHDGDLDRHRAVCMRFLWLWRPSPTNHPAWL